jgi:hypothetical protein
MLRPVHTEEGKKNLTISENELYAEAKIITDVQKAETDSNNGKPKFSSISKITTELY